MLRKNETRVAGVMLVLFVISAASFAAGLLKPIEGGDKNDVKIKSHTVNVTINNGFARTEVDQVFFNYGTSDLRAIYSFPVPKQASLSELSLWINGNEIVGEVLEKEIAKKIHEEQIQKGNDTALAEKDDYKTFDVSVYPVRANAETRVRLVYYQPIEIDLNIGRYVYPLAEGGVDEERIAFWSVDDQVEESFKFDLELKSAFPVKDVRVPDYVNKAVIEKIAKDANQPDYNTNYHVMIESPEGDSLNKDIIVYYRLDDKVPARVELIPYRENVNSTGTFMVVVTPAADLKRISEGVDWVFVLDKSGSMSGGKIVSLADGVSKVIGKMSPNDRFRIITFNHNASDLSGGYIQATPENIQSIIETIKSIDADGSTNLYAGLEMAYGGLDDDRTTSVILVTDGVANVGNTEHKQFINLLRKYDIRLFTFVIGNSANQPLMDRLAEESGGFAMNISTSDDIVGRILQAKAKILFENMHDVELEFHGEKVKNLTAKKIGNLYQGQQLVMFGQFDGTGDVQIELKAKISGVPQSWTCTAQLPDVDIDNPEIERLWALSGIEDVMKDIRENGETEALRKQIVELGTEYSLVTDYTSMLVVAEIEMEELGIQRKNADRVNSERQAQQARQNAPVKNYRVDNQNGQTGAFKGLPSPNVGTGPVGPVFLALTLYLKRRRQQK
ncbi:MAG: VWA domain-containing protein [Planctomycetes bacterium GWF2_41_51]|nr:MAG: VWA domain-containing protein [Planctomycetes bacterium GWF2_41_51]HBG28185.1 VWA domain-containing protein [Phycisphaerales bacterium]